MVPVVDCGPTASAIHVEASVLRLTAAVKELQNLPDSTESEAVRVLLMDAQDELQKLSSKCLRACEQESGTDEEQLPPFSEEEDLALLQTIPLQDLLGTCFEQHKKESRPSSGCISSVSTMSSLGGSSLQACSTPASRSSFAASFAVSLGSLSIEAAPPTRLSLTSTCMSPRPTLPSVDWFSYKELGFMTSCESQRPTLPGRTSCGSNWHPQEVKASASFQGEDMIPERTGENATTFPACLTKYDYSAKPRRGGCQVTMAATSECVSATVMASVVPIDEEEQEEETDAWELEFLRQSMLD